MCFFGRLTRGRGGASSPFSLSLLAAHAPRADASSPSARRPEKFGTYTFERDEVLRATELAKEAVRASAFLQREVEEEERCFKQFSVWLHYGASSSRSPLHLNRAGPVADVLSRASQSSTRSRSKKGPRSARSPPSTRSPSRTTSSTASPLPPRPSRPSSHSASRAHRSRTAPSSRPPRPGSPSCPSARAPCATPSSGSSRATA